MDSWPDDRDAFEYLPTLWPSPSQFAVETFHDDPLLAKNILPALKYDAIDEYPPIPPSAGQCLPIREISTSFRDLKDAYLKEYRVANGYLDATAYEQSQKDRLSHGYGQESIGSFLSPRPGSASFSNELSRHQSVSHQPSLSSLNSAYNACSTTSRRGPTIPRGYPCAEVGCGKASDRPGDLKQHSRNHVPMEDRPHGCDSGDQRFTFPKDLRRHQERKHSSTPELPSPNKYSSKWKRRLSRGSFSDVSEGEQPRRKSKLAKLDQIDQVKSDHSQDQSDDDDDLPEGAKELMALLDPKKNGSKAAFKVAKHALKAIGALLTAGMEKESRKAKSYDG